MKKPLILKPDYFLQFIHCLGLEINEKTGGHLVKNTPIEGYSSVGPNAFTLHIKNEEPILFMDNTMFLKTVKRTEDSLQMKLFI